MNKGSKGLLIFVPLISILLLAYLSLPFLLTTLASHLIKKEVSLEKLVLSQGQIKGLKVNGTDFTLRASEARIAKPFSGLIRGDLEEVALIEPSLHLIALSGKDTDLGFIKRLPQIRRLRIERGSLRLTEKDSDYEIVLSDMRVNIQDYSPKGGGKMAFNFRYSLTNRVAGRLVVTGTVSGDSIIRPYVGDLALEGDIDLSVDGLSSGPISIGQLKTRGRFAYEKKTLSLREVSLDVSDIAAKTDKETISFGPLSAKTELFFNPNTKYMKVINLSGLLKAIGNFNGDIDLKLTGDYSYRSNLTMPKVDIKALIELIKPLLSDDLRQWSLAGKASVKATLKGNFKGGQPHLEGEAIVGLNEGSFLSQDALKAGQGIAAEFVMGLRYPQSVKKKSIQIGLNTRLTEGEYLWDSLYINLKDSHLVIETGLLLPLDKAGEMELTLKTDLMATGDYKVFVVGPFGQWRVKTHLSGIDLKGLQGSVFRDSLSNIWPILRDLDIGGLADLEIETHLKHKGPLIQGLIDIKGLSLMSSSKDIEIRGLNARLPILISPEIDWVRNDNNTGLVSIQTAKVKNIELGDIHIPLVSETNRLTLIEPLRLPFSGGSLDIESLEVGVDSQHELWLKGSIRLSETNIAPITEALGLGPFNGRLNSHIPNVRLKGRSISTEGQIDIELFGGRVVLSNIRGQIPFNYMGADIEFSNIDLERLTETLKIGRITGIVKGFIKDLEVQYGQAARFVMEIDSVPVEGVPQLVSTDAVESISILGTGAEGLSRVLSSGINQFFKEFPYKRLGLRCTLENDVFTIRGKIREGGKEYIIRRGLFRGIDVINHNPENTISFREMQTRLNAILQKNETR